MRKKIVAGNWKMNKTFDEANALLSEVVNQVNTDVTNEVTVVICPPSVYLSTARQHIPSGSRIRLGAQNCSGKESGAYTGDVSAAMLKSVGVEYVIAGHSERRHYHGETNAQVAEKVNLVLANGLIPIFCCGESQDTRQNGDFVGFVKGQITDSLFHLSAEEFAHVVFAYEPIWAIGTGLTASSVQAQDMHFEIRRHIADQYGEAVAQDITILYGGSANPHNAADLFAQPDVDGGLIGGASLNARDFILVIQAAQ